jgi:hypothetical protein
VPPRLLVTVFAPVDGWTTVLWPEYFNSHDVVACQDLSDVLDTVVSTVSVAGSAGWIHALLDSGTVTDTFASYPRALAWEESEVESVARAWAGDPARVASVLGVPVASVAPHFRQAVADEADEVEGEDLERRGRLRIWWPRSTPHDGAKQTPERDPADPWGFVQFWRDVGITYPVGRVPVQQRLLLDQDWQARVPRNTT